MDTNLAPPASHPTGARPDIPITTTAAVRTQRRPWVVALSLALAVVLALTAVWAVNAAGDRQKVLAVARNVPAGTELSARDIVVAEVSADANLQPVPATDRAAVLGKRTAVDLRKGGLLQQSALSAGTGLGDDQQQVGVPLKRGHAPEGALAPGDKVQAVTTPAEGDEETAGRKETPPTTIAATVVSVGRADASGNIVVNLAVPTTDGPTLATLAAAGRIALVREPRS